MKNSQQGRAGEAGLGEEPASPSVPAESTHATGVVGNWPAIKTLRAYMGERSWYFQRNAWREYAAHPIDLFRLWRTIRAMRRLDATLGRIQGDARLLVAQHRGTFEALGALRPSNVSYAAKEDGNDGG